jgi:hypothetical protein
MLPRLNHWYQREQSLNELNGFHGGELAVDVPKASELQKNGLVKVEPLAKLQNHVGNPGRSGDKR